MKKFLLSAIALLAVTFVNAQSLSLVIQDHKTKEDVATLKSGDTYDAGSLWDGFMDRGVYFYIKNASDKSGKFTFESWELVSGETPEDFRGVGICSKGTGCIPEIKGFSCDIKANQDFHNDMDFSFFGVGSLEYKITAKFSAESEPYTFNFKVKLGDPSSSSINSVSSDENNVKFYQNGNTVVMDYMFNEAASRNVSIVSLSGNTLYTCNLDGESGSLNIPVELGAGVYLYTVKDENNGVITRKFVVR